MPTFPAMIGRFAETLSGYAAEVLRVTEPAPGFLDVEFRVESPPGGWQPGHEVQIMVTATEARRYTAHRIHEPDRIHLLVALDANGTGSTWMRQLAPGALATLVAAKHRPLRIRGDRPLLLGDGSALGSLDAYAKTRQPPCVVLEVPPGSIPGLHQRWPDYRLLPAGATPGTTTQRWLERALVHGEFVAIDSALLLGHADSIQRQRRALIANKVLDRRAITTKPYWATGRKGL